MFFNTNQIVFQRIPSSVFLENGLSTDISYYIIDAGIEISLASVEFKVEKASGRDLQVLTAWTQVDITGVLDDIFTLPITVSGVNPTDTLMISIRATTSDGVEAFHKDTEVTVI